MLCYVHDIFHSRRVGDRGLGHTLGDVRCDFTGETITSLATLVAGDMIWFTRLERAN
jgi:hypothetical protein